MNREDFPMLKDDIIYFDNGATTLKPYQVKEAIIEYYDHYTANAHRGDYAISAKVDNIYEGTRHKIKELINANEDSEIVFTSGSTQSMNYIIFGFFAHKLQKDDEVLITVSEHASNILPWFVIAKQIGIKVKYIELDENYNVTIENVKKAITPKTKVISLAHITNVIGDIRPIKEISELAHQKNIYMVVDAAQSIAHKKIDVTDWNIDFLVASAHKMYGPTGIGFLYGKFNLLEETIPQNYGGGMNAMFTKEGYYELREVPTRFEAGTPNIEGVIGFNAAIEYINNIGISKIEKYEHELKTYLVEELKKLDFVEIYNPNTIGTTVAFNLKGVFAQDTAIYLDKYHICVRAGSHCAKILSDALKINNTCRISLSFYNNKEEIDLLINVLKNSKNIWKEIL